VGSVHPALRHATDHQALAAAVESLRSTATPSCPRATAQRPPSVDPAVEEVRLSGAAAVDDAAVSAALAQDIDKLAPSKHMTMSTDRRFDSRDTSLAQSLLRCLRQQFRVSGTHGVTWEVLKSALSAHGVSVESVDAKEFGSAWALLGMPKSVRTTVNRVKRSVYPGFRLATEAELAALSAQAAASGAASRAGAAAGAGQTRTRDAEAGAERARVCAE
jgi:hypothetical protein